MVSDEFAILRQEVREAVERTSLRNVADAADLSHGTVHSFLNDGRPTARTVRKLEEWSGRHGSRDPVAPADEWTQFALETVRYAGGQGQWSEEEQRLIKLDVLEGLIRLGVAAGKDVGMLQDKQRELRAAVTGGPPSLGGGDLRTRPATPSAADVLAYYDRESRAAELRAAGMREWAVAVRIAEEETRARREQVSLAGETEDERDLRRARAVVQSHALAKRADQAALQTAPPGGPPATRGTAEGEKPSPPPRP